MRRRLLAMLVLMSVYAAGFEVPRDVRSHFAGRTLTPVEGAWLWTNGALVTIDADSRGGIVMTLVDSPDPLVETPVTIGRGRYGGKSDTYNIEMSVGDGSGLGGKPKTAKFVAKISEAGRLTLTPYSTNVKVNAWRLLPYLFRFSVTRNSAPDGMEGAIRVWPPMGSPEFPIVL